MLIKSMKPFVRDFPVNQSVYTAQQVREIELAYGQDNQGTYALMERAGLAAYKTIREYFPRAKNLLILTGKGNNGGDGYLVAKHAVEDELSVSLCTFCPPEKLSGDAKLAYESFETIAQYLIDWEDIDLTDYDLIVDAMLGTGIKGEIRAPFIVPIQAISKSNVPVFSIDVPSGLEADTGHVFSEAVCADVTLTFVGLKRGLCTANAIEKCGRLILDNLSIDNRYFEANQSQVFAHNLNSLKSKIKPRNPNSHKGQFGHCVVIGGNKGMAGAALMASVAAARVGTGLISAKVAKGANTIIGYQPEIMAKNCAEADILSEIASLNDRHTLVIGPGLGQNDWSNVWLKELLGTSVYFAQDEVKDGHATRANTLNNRLKTIQKVVDADALNWLAKHQAFSDCWVLTPHPGEAARLLGCSVDEVNRDRYVAASQIVKRYGGVCVLKGAGTIVADNKRLCVLPVGNSAMSSGGMGDVLAGIVGGILAQGFGFFESAILAVAIHGRAGELSAKTLNSDRGVLASDLFAHIPHLVSHDSFI